MWSLQTITPPALEPLDLHTEVKQQLKLAPFEVADQATVLAGYISAARALCETFTGRQLITASYQLWLSSWYECGIYRGGYIRLPRPPGGTVSAITYLDSAGATQTWDPAEWEVVQPTGERAGYTTLFPTYGFSQPSVLGQAASIKIAYSAGYGLTFASVPAALRMGMLLIVEELFNNRGQSTTGTIVIDNKLVAEDLWTPYRVDW